MNQKVRIKQGVKCPDYEMDISGFSGEIIAKYNIGDSFFVVWNETTLNKLPHDYILDSVAKGLDYTAIIINKDKVEIE